MKMKHPKPQTPLDVPSAQKHQSSMLSKSMLKHQCWLSNPFGIEAIAFLENVAKNLKQNLIMVFSSLFLIMLTIGNGYAQSNIFSINSSLPYSAIQNNDTTICLGDSLALTSFLNSNFFVIENLDSGLIGYWPFNGDANDESGNGNHGVINGATLTCDRYGNPDMAYSFDGNDYITALRPGLTTFTVSCWVYIEQVQYYTPIIDANV